MKIRAKLICMSLGMSSLVAFVGILAVNRQYASAKIAATKEAVDVGHLVSFMLLSDSKDRLPDSSLLKIVSKLHQQQGRDVSIMDPERRILADAVPSEVGRIFSHDSNDEVGKTLKDRQSRTFIEISKDYPAGIRQIVVPVEGESGQGLGAVVLEYTPLYDELIKLTRRAFLQIVVVGIAAITMALFLAFHVGRSIASPLEKLTEMAAAFASGQTDFCMIRPRKDEIGELAAAFTNMVDKRGQIEGELRCLRDELETRVARRAAELGEANQALQRQQVELRALFDLLPAMVWFKDTENTILRVNKRVAETAGKSVGEIEGKPSVEIYPEEAEKFYADDLEVIRSGVPKLRYVETVRGANGRNLWVQTDKVPVSDENGKVIGIVVMAQDITARRQAEETLRESEEKFRQLANNIKDVFWICSPDFSSVHYVSPGYEAIWGRSMEDLYADSRQWEDAILPEERERVFDVFATLAGKGAEVSVEYRIHRSNGEIRWIHDRAFRVQSASGELVRIAGIASDITERKRSEAALEKAHKDLLETSRRAGMAEVATGVLHNVGNVLNSVNISATLVGESLKRSKVGNLARVVALLDQHASDLGAFVTAESQGKKLPTYLRQLSDRLLEEQKCASTEIDSLRQNIEHIKEIVFMQQEYAKVSGVTEVLKITDLVEDSLRMNSAALERHGVTVERDFQDMPPISIEKHKILQIMVNLIRNAKCACEDSGREDKRITLGVTKGDGTVEISVSDNGIGIPSENLTRIFNHGFTTRKDGHGFGLHSGALAAMELGGSLSAESPGPGRGAIFTLKLPAVHSA